MEEGQEAILFDQVLERLKEHGLVIGKASQRTDFTCVLAAVRNLNGLECVGETLRLLLHELARVAPDWPSAQITSDWLDRYGAQLEAYRLPKE